MKSIISFLILIGRIFVIYSVIKILWISHYDINTQNINNLIWWICLMVFDIWLILTLIGIDGEKP
jgi:hypothetical protein